MWTYKHTMKTTQYCIYTVDFGTFPVYPECIVF